MPNLVAVAGPLPAAAPRLFARRPVIALAALAAAGLAAPTLAQTVLTLSSWVPPSLILSETQKDWCTQLEQKAPGKVKCTVLPRAVSAPPGTFDAVRNGLADVSFTVHGYTPGRFVTTQMAEFPFMGNSSEATSVAFQRIYAKYPAFAEEHKGVKVLAVFTHGPGMAFNTKKPVSKVEDLAGLKWRAGTGAAGGPARRVGRPGTAPPTAARPGRPPAGRAVAPCSSGCRS